MAIGVRVESLDALRSFKIALVKFAEAANVALGDADSELQRTLTWLETEQLSYWQGQHRKRAEMVTRAKEAGTCRMGEPSAAKGELAASASLRLK